MYSETFRILKFQFHALSYSIKAYKKTHKTQLTPQTQLQLSTKSSKKMNLLTIVLIACIADAALSFQSSSDSRSLDTFWRNNSPTSCAAHVAKTQCTTAQSSSRYPSYDGSCHSVTNGQFGLANTPLKRWLAASYNDGINSPRSRSVLGTSDLPNPRTISGSLMTENSAEEAIWTHIWATFGQFLTHDLAETALVSTDGTVKFSDFKIFTN